MPMISTQINSKNKSANKFTNTSFYNSPFLPKKHNHVELIFENFKIIYNDPRRFGFFQLIKNNTDLVKRFSHLGPEPFDKNFNLNYVFDFFKDKNKDIKNFLLDQKFVSGIGNIYASEILFLSKVNPFKKVKLLSKKECQKIITNSRKILLKAISKGGSSIRDFKDTSGSKGGFQNEFKVYQQEGLQCKNRGCSDFIRKKIISNRSTFFCDSCQKQPIILLTTINSQAIPLRIWQTQNQQLRELEEFLNKLQLIKQEKADLETLLKK